MGKVFIIVSTIILLLVVIQRNTSNNIRLFKRLKNIIFEINSVYLELFKDRSLARRIIQGTLIIVAEIFITVSVATAVLIIISVSLVLIHFCMGYILLSTVKIHKFIYGVENVNLKIDLLLSYFIISTYFTVLLIFPQQFKSCYKIGLLGVSICYILNIKILVALMNDPYKIKSKSQDETNFSRVIIASILIVVLIILNLYLAVCFVSDTGKDAFSNSPNYFDLFYYTIITFTTVGYGDIVPITMEAKIVSSLISITNIICITIFLSTILSYRDKIKSDI